jgi:ribosomal protein S18 acetylase RimI-like enzyme
MTGIRPATLADIPRLHALIERAYRGDAARQGWTNEAHLLGGTRTTPEALEAQIGDPDTAILVHPEMLACVQVTRLAGARAYLGQLGVDPTQQARGLGRTMLEAAQEFAHRHYAAMWMEMTVIDVRTELLQWYARRGYLPTGEVLPMPEDAGPSTVPIALLVLERPLP